MSPPPRFSVTSVQCHRRRGVHLAPLHTLPVLSCLSPEIRHRHSTGRRSSIDKALCCPQRHECSQPSNGLTSAYFAHVCETCSLGAQKRTRSIRKGSNKGKGRCKRPNFLVQIYKFPNVYHRKEAFGTNKFKLFGSYQP
ncbi:unnamed protein product, partial [Scytosiphon promiscuus]